MRYASADDYDDALMRASHLSPMPSDTPIMPMPSAADFRRQLPPMSADAAELPRRRAYAAAPPMPRAPLTRCRRYDERR